MNHAAAGGGEGVLDGGGGASCGPSRAVTPTTTVAAAAETVPGSEWAAVDISGIVAAVAAGLHLEPVAQGGEGRRHGKAGALDDLPVVLAKAASCTPQDRLHHRDGRPVEGGQFAVPEAVDVPSNEEFGLTGVDRRQCLDHLGTADAGQRPGLGAVGRLRRGECGERLA